jgi:hypothetical protein
MVHIADGHAQPPTNGATHRCTRGKPEPLAGQSAARAIDKERAQHGESVTASASPINGMSAGLRALG